MKFLCLCYYDATKFAAWTPADHEGIGKACAPHDKALRDSAKMLMVASLALPEEATCIRPTDAGPVTSTGAYVPTNEPLGALFLLEAADMAEATRLAALHPGAHLGAYFGGGIEVRAIDYVEQL